MRLYVLLGVLLLVGCVDEQLDPAPSPIFPQIDVADSFPPPPEGEGFQLAFEYNAPALAESWNCLVGEIPPATVHPVQTALSRQSESVHHMNVAILPFAESLIPTGLWPCEELYNAYPEVMETGIALFGSQNPEFDALLPPGVVAPVPGGIQYVHELHYVNADTVDVTAWSKINVFTIDPEDIVDTINGFSKNDRNLHIPPQTQHTEWTRCVMTEDIDVLFMTSHTHELGANFEVHLFDGTNVGGLVYENADWHAPPLKSFTSEPLHVAAGTGFQWSCHFDNPNDYEVNWGQKSTDEMCQMIIAFSPGTSGINCVRVESSDGVLN
jgi:hypothetical protein